MSLKKLSALVLLMCMLFALTACGSNGTPSQPSTPEATTTAPTDPTEPPLPKISQEEAQKIAEDLVVRYRNYIYFGWCCDDEYTEYSSADLATTLIYEEVDFPMSAYRITCCKTAEECQAHLLRVLDPSLLNPRIKTNLGFDDQGNMYGLVIPGEASSYQNVVVLEHSSDTIIAQADIVSLDSTGHIQFTITHNGTGFVISAVN